MGLDAAHMEYMKSLFKKVAPTKSCTHPSPVDRCWCSAYTRSVIKSIIINSTTFDAVMQMHADLGCPLPALVELLILRGLTASTVVGEEIKLARAGPHRIPDAPVGDEPTW